MVVMVKTLGFVGLGVMGEKMCRNLLKKSGKSVVVFDLNPTPVQQLVSEGAKAATSLAEVARDADVIFLSLPGEPQVKAVCLGDDGLFSHGRAGQTVVDTSTNAVGCVRAIAERLKEKDMDFADAPVSRTREAAAEGTLSIMVGAEPAVFERIKPLLACMGTEITHCGGVGNGEIVKIINNMLNFEIVLAVAEALTLGTRAGMDPALLLDTLGKGSSNSFVLQQHGKKFMLPRHFPRSAFSANYVLKDLSYALALGEETGVALDCARVARTYYRKMIESGQGDEYFPAEIGLVEQGESLCRCDPAAVEVVGG